MQISMVEAEGPQLDISKPEVGVIIDIRQDGKVLWVNVDGILRLRISDIPSLIVNDSRKHK